MAHGVVRTDLLSSTDVRSKLTSVRYQPSGVKAPIDNGNVVLVGKLENGSRTVRKGLIPSANSDIKSIALIATPEVEYDEHIHSLKDFFNKPGAICRGYILHKLDVFSVTIDALDASGTPSVGDIAELESGTKIKIVSEATSGSTTIGKIIDVNNVGGLTYYVIQVDLESGSGGGEDTDVVGTAVVGTSRVRGE